MKSAARICMDKLLSAIDYQQVTNKA